MTDELKKEQDVKAVNDANADETDVKDAGKSLLSDEGVDDDADEPTVYELGYHLIPTLTEESASAEAVALKAVIEETKGVFVAEEKPKTMNLAYTIYVRTGEKKQKFDTAYFGWIKFEILPEYLSALKEALDGNANILRFLLIKTVRESTLAPKRVLFEHVDTAPARPIAKPPVKKEEPVKKLSEEELEKTIEELIAE